MQHPARALFIAAAIALATLTGCNSHDTTAPTTATIGSAMPAFRMQPLAGGETLASQDLFAGKVIILNAWATWCPPCRQEMPDLIRLSQLLPKEKFIVVGLAVDNNTKDVQRFVDTHHIPFPIFTDPNGKTVARPILKSFKYPETFIINRDGIIVEKVIGAFPWAEPQIITILQGIYKTGKIPKAT